MSSDRHGCESRGRRQIDPDRRATARLAVQLQSPAMRTNDLMHDPQTQPGTVRGGRRLGDMLP